MALSNIEAEASLLGCILISSAQKDESIYSDIFLQVGAEDITEPEYIKIYITANKLFKANKPIDIVTLSAADNTISIITLSDLIRNVPSASNYQSYIAIIKAKTAVRELVSVANDIIAAKDDNPLITRDKALQRLQKVGESVEVEMSGIGKEVDDVLQEIEDRKKGEYNKNSIRSPYKRMNYYINLAAGEVCVIAARPGIGKSAFASEIILNAALKHNKQVAFFNLEMSSKDLVKRMFSNILKVSISDIENLSCDTSKLLSTAETLKKASIYINTTNYNIDSIIRACKVQQKKTGLDLVVIDYLQLIGTRGQFNNRNEEVSYVSRQLKLLAMELKIPIIELSQMNRSFERGEDRSPQLSDLRESGSIEQDASAVIFLSREKKKEQGINFRADIDRYITASIAKNRNGATGDFYLKFKGDEMGFCEINKDGTPFVLPNANTQTSIDKITITEVNEDLPF